MPTKLDCLYHSFYNPIEQTELKSSIEENHKKLVQILSKEDKVLVLRIIDALEMVCNYQSKDSFIQGFKLGFEMKTELQNYDSHSFEIDSQNCGNSFMSQEVQKDEEES